MFRYNSSFYRILSCEWRTMNGTGRFGSPTHGTCQEKNRDSHEVINKQFWKCWKTIFYKFFKKTRRRSKVKKIKTKKKKKTTRRKVFFSCKTIAHFTWSLYPEALTVLSSFILFIYVLPILFLTICVCYGPPQWLGKSFTRWITTTTKVKVWPK